MDGSGIAIRAGWSDVYAGGSGEEDEGAGVRSGEAGGCADRGFDRMGLKFADADHLLISEFTLSDGDKTVTVTAGRREDFAAT